MKLIFNDNFSIDDITEDSLFFAQCFKHSFTLKIILIKKEKNKIFQFDEDLHEFVLFDYEDIINIHKIDLSLYSEFKERWRLLEYLVDLTEDIEACSISITKPFFSIVHKDINYLIELMNLMDYYYPEFKTFGTLKVGSGVFFQVYKLIKDDEII